MNCDSAVRRLYLHGVIQKQKSSVSLCIQSEACLLYTSCRLYPENATLLVDTYNVLERGVPNAIKAFEAVLKPLGIKKCGIRIDSGDITYLSKKARKMLDDAGWTECKIIASNSLDEYIIKELIYQGAKIDGFGVGERLITSTTCLLYTSRCV